MVTRREWLGIAVGTSAARGGAPGLLAALQRTLARGPLLERAIPSTGERIPVVGLGSSATFAQVARGEDAAALREVLRALVDGGARVFDTAPQYGSAEEVAARLVNELGIRDRLFWATKVNVAGRGAPTADRAAARAQIETSFARIGRAKVDLIQVHNLGDVPTQLAILRELKRQGRVRYVGVTTTFDEQYPQLVEIMRAEPLDFVGVDYAVDNRGVEETILPLARERKIGVLAYAPFGRTSLFRRTASTPLPDWARDFDATTWAQFFLKFVVSHPAVTAVTPATSRASNMVDNLGGGVGRLPDAATRQRMVALIESLPAPAPQGRRPPGD